MSKTFDESETARASVAAVANGFLAGCIGGAIASWAMNQYSAVTSQTLEARRAAQAKQKNGGNSAEKSMQSGDDATVKTAQAISRKVFEHELTPGEKKVAGPAVHYGYGTLVGGLYGALAEVVPGAAVGLGIPYGLFLWLIGDEIAVPALGLGSKPTETTLDQHASALSAHFFYSIVLDVTRRVLRHIV